MGCVAGIILAAGKSSRMGGEIKLLLDVHGKPMLRHVVESALHSALDEVIVVLGYEHERILESIDFKGATVVFNPDFLKGQSTSLKAGIAAVGESCDAALFLLGDLPLVCPGVIDAVVQKYKSTHASIVVPVFAGKRGNPVLLARSLFPMVLALEGDIGARPILAAHKDLIETVDIEHDGIHLDVDTWEDYRTVNKVPICWRVIVTPAKPAPEVSNPGAGVQ
jgi:molybdenum cofactor cytidylyltransferase